ncbi:hypothetical protein BCV70DRAFT_201172 [Testicularia cyperi]|uniref:Uncharacterized protein n=1 Tax=Testicularia cyperi TaxID=1882483 RepID=A0A317XM58_9BASI|nr:hypothetical protein BCV70DRAFT_201172 [Testicularia cyperi]
MATRSPAASPIKPRRLPLGLMPYHVVFIAGLSSIVLLGTVYSVVYGTHLSNVGYAEFPASDLGQTIPAPGPGAPGGLGEALPPIPPTILQPNHALNYWANRKNIVNQIFVKKAWLWTTGVWLLQLFYLRMSPVQSLEQKKSDDPTKSSASTSNGTKLEAQARAVAAEQATITSPVSVSVLRYIFSTLIWLLFANWFFGPPLSERLLTATGAICVPSTDPLSPIEALYCQNRSPLSSSTHPALFPASGLGKSTARAIWKGGHDISGHTFLMVLSSLFLLEDLAPYIPRFLGLANGNGILQSIFPQSSWSSQPNTFVGPNAPKAKAAVLATLGLVALWSWMLLNTAIYFHTPQEKVSGLFVGLAAWFCLPRGG